MTSAATPPPSPTRSEASDALRVYRFLVALCASGPVHFVVAMMATERQYPINLYYLFVLILAGVLAVLTVGPLRRISAVWWLLLLPVASLLAPIPGYPLYGLFVIGLLLVPLVSVGFLLCGLVKKDEPLVFWSILVVAIEIGVIAVFLALAMTPLLA